MSADNMKKEGPADYRIDHLSAKDWPPAQEAEPGKWERVWHVVLTHESPRISEHQVFSGEGEHMFTASIASHGPRAIKLTVTSDTPAMLHEFYGNYGSVFRYIENSIGDIDTIEGWPKNEWWPWYTHGEIPPDSGATHWISKKK